MVDLFRGAAQRPFLPFFMLMVISAATAACIFFYFQSPDLSVISQDQSTPAPDSFDAARAQKYLKIFSIIKQNKDDYDQMATSTYSDVFRSASGAAR